MLGDRAAPVLARVVFAVATPALLLTTVAHADLHLLLSRQAVVTWTSTIVVALVAVLVLRLVLRRPAADVTVGTLASSYVNAGNLGLPLAVYLLDDAVTVVPTLLFQLLILAPVAFAVLDRGSRGGSVMRRTLSNPIIVGTLIGLLLAALPWSLPDVLYEPFRLVGAAAAPLALLTFGMSLALPRTVDTAAPRADLALAVGLRTLVASCSTSAPSTGRRPSGSTARSSAPTAAATTPSPSTSPTP